YCIALLPVMGLTDVYFMKYTLVSDHYQYIALLSIAACAAVALCRLPAGTARALIRGGLPAALGGLTWLQSHQYVNAETLYRATLAANPDAWMAHNNLALIYLGGPGADPQEALAHLQAAAATNPSEPSIQNNLGAALFQMGRFADAIERHR